MIGYSVQFHLFILFSFPSIQVRKRTFVSLFLSTFLPSSPDHFSFQFFPKERIEMKVDSIWMDGQNERLNNQRSREKERKRERKKKEEREEEGERSGKEIE